MNILNVSLYMSCNYGCDYCPVKKWLVPLDDSSHNLLTNESLLKWLDKYLKPEEWHIELTGGEPGLYPEIDTLIPALTERGYHGQIKTNGSLPIPASPNFTRCVAWHKDKDFPQYYDQIAIIKNPDDDWQKKEARCKKHKIPHRLLDFDTRSCGNRNISELMQGYPPNKTIYSQHINDRGQVTCCPAATPVMQEGKMTIFEMVEPFYTAILSRCNTCKNVHDVEIFLPDEIRQKFEEDFNGRLI